MLLNVKNQPAMTYATPAFLIDLTLHTLPPSKLKTLQVCACLLLVLVVFAFTLWHVFANVLVVAVGVLVCCGLLGLFAYAELTAGWGTGVAKQAPLHLVQLDLQQWRLNKRPVQLLNARHVGLGCAIGLSFQVGAANCTYVIWQDTVSATCWRNLCVLVTLLGRGMGS
jgi:hypothetical protein